jgi:hypothetical protein
VSDVIDRTRLGPLLLLATVLLASACGREAPLGRVELTSAQAPSTPDPTPSPEPKPEPTPSTPRPEPVQAAAGTAAPAPPTASPTPRLPGGPDGSDDTKRDSGVRGRVVAGDRPVADAVVSVRGEGFHANSTTGPGGRFHIHAPAGTYLVGASAHNASVHCTDRTVAVPETSFTTITISCTG